MDRRGYGLALLALVAVALAGGASHWSPVARAGPPGMQAGQQGGAPTPSAAAPLRVPPYVESAFGVTRGGAAPTPVVLGRAPEITLPAVAQAAVQRARDGGSQVVLVLDGPGAGPQSGGYLPIRGWAADLLANTPGIDPNNVQVWLSGATGTPLGFAQYGWQRDDVVRLLGDSRYGPSGFRLAWQTCTFSPGTYHVVAYGWRQQSVDFDSADVEVTVPNCQAPAGTVLFADPLDGRNPWGRDWSTGADDQCVLRYSGAEYRVRKLGATSVADCAAPDVERTVYGDFALDLDVRLDEAAPGAVAAIGVRMNVAEFSTGYLAGYVVRLDPTRGTVALVYDEGRAQTPLAEAQPASLRRGTAVNHLRIVAEGPALQVLVNDAPALAVQDARNTWGAITLGAGAPEGQTAEAVYRNLVVARVGGPAAPAAAAPAATAIPGLLDPATSRCPPPSGDTTTVRGAAPGAAGAMPTGC